MKFLYITGAPIPSELAHSLQIIKMCEALQWQGATVTLIIPTWGAARAARQVQALWAYYDVKTPFTVQYLATPDLVCLVKKLPQIVQVGAYYLQAFLFSWLAFAWTFFRPEPFYYTRSLQTLSVLCAMKWLHRKKIYFEAHEFHGDPGQKGLFRRFGTCMMQWLLRHSDGLVVITHRLRSLYLEMGMPGASICVACDGVDRKRLSQARDQRRDRQALSISLDKKVVCYTGHLFDWKGVYTLAVSSAYLPEDYRIYIVGGLERDVQALRQFVAEQRLTHVVLTGYVPYVEVPRYLSAADLLALPNSAKHRNSREYTSPLKLFDYMGARRPIVASDLPSVREILRHQQNAYLVPPDDPKCLAEGILAVFAEPGLAEAISNMAYADVQAYTWEQRAQKILAFLAAQL